MGEEATSVPHTHGTKIYKVLQTNLQRSALATNELFLEARKRNISFALVQEPYVGAAGELKRYSGTRILQCEQNRTKPVKAAIVVFDDDIEILNDQTTINENIVLTCFKTTRWTIALVSVYFENNQPLQPYLNKLREFLDRTRTDKTLVGGDINAWSTWWGSVREDERGDLYRGFLDEMDWHILNQGTDPTYDTVRGERLFTSCVDVTVCSPHMLKYVSDWRVDKEVTCSDHNAIAFRLDLEKAPEEKRRKSTRIYNTRKANWSRFTEELQNSLKGNNITVSHIANIQDREQLEEIVQSYIECMRKACDNAVPLIRNKHRKKFLPWWTDELDTLKSAVNTKRRRIRSAAPKRRRHVVEEYLEAKTVYENEVSKVQTESWKRYCTKQDRESMWDSVYRVIRGKSGGQEDLLLEDGGVTLSPEKSVELLAKTFYPDDNSLEDNDIHEDIRRKAGTLCDSISSDINDPSFTMAELIRTVSSFNPQKAPGPDGFTADICRRAVFAEKEVFLEILNRCLHLSYFPSPWKEAAVVVLRKPGKSDYTKAKSYRPIGLLSVLGKVLEKMLVRRIRWHLLPRTNPKQYGFVPQRSTEDALYDLVQQVQANLRSKEMMVIVSLDIEGAFDSAWWPAIKSQLIRLKCPLNLRRLVNSYFEGRKVVVSYAGRSYAKDTNKGCVQGSIGGPTFWNLLLDPLLNDLVTRDVYTQAFADDVVLMISGHTAVKIQEKVNQTLAYVHEWGIRNKLKFSAHKTHAMVVTKKLKYDTPIMRMGENEIPIVDEIRLLGLTIDKKLTFNSHVTNVCRKAMNIYKQLARTAKLEWGLSSEIVRTIYVAVIEPIVMYASSAWSPASEKIMVQNQLNALQRRFAQKICKAYRTVPLNAALVLTGLLPLDLRVQEAAQLYEAKRGKLTVLDCGKRQIEKRVCFLKAPHPALEENIEFICINDMRPDTLTQYQLPEAQIFTDGSKMEGKVGAAYTYWIRGREAKSKKMRLESFCSVFQAELYALLQATELLMKEKIREAAVLSDSRSALELVKNPDAFHPLGFKIRQNITSLKSRGCKVRLYWVKAHAGAPGNERADELAKQAARYTKCAPHYDRCPVSSAKYEIRQKTIEAWRKRYTDSTTAEVTKTFLPDVATAIKIVRKMKITPILTQVLTGHGGFSAYLNRFKCKESPSCICENDKEETILHLLIECPKYSANRHDLESATNVKLTAASLCELIAGEDTRAYLFAFCAKVASDAVHRNKTR